MLDLDDLGKESVVQNEKEECAHEEEIRWMSLRDQIFYSYN